MASMLRRLSIFRPQVSHRCYTEVDTTLNTTVSRFYKDEGRTKDDGYVILLDGRVLKTPKKVSLRLPTEALAYTVASEWQAQKKKLFFVTMPITRIVMTAIDQMPAMRARVIPTLVNFLQSDVVCYREDRRGALARQQDAVWNPLLDFVAQRYNVQLNTTKGIVPVDQPLQSLDNLEAYLHTLDNWHLTGFEAVATTAKSVVIGLCVHGRKLNSVNALAASRVDEDFQISEWGEVEGGHDMDKADLTVRLSSAALYLRLLPPPQPLAHTHHDITHHSHHSHHSHHHHARHSHSG